MGGQTEFANSYAAYEALSPEMKQRVAGLKHAEKAPMAANRNLAYVKAFFNWCIDQEIVESNPAATIK